jgi:hypothetical protein
VLKESPEAVVEQEEVAVDTDSEES